VDGSLRDIYIYDVTLEDWDRLLNLLKLLYPLESDEKIIADSIREIIPIAQERGFLLRIMIGDGITANCHFYISEGHPSPIEFDIDPREIQSVYGMKKVLQFIRQMGNELHKEVFLTEENSEDFILLSYSPFSKKYSYYLENGEIQTL
jgi:hypothetical protein